MRPPLPAKIGRYEVVDRLGEGGMGVVCLARDPLLRRTVAIKLLPSADEEMRERFAREARSAASLRHNNIVTIYDVGDEGGQAFLAMEFIDGESMAQLIHRRAPIGLARKLQYMIELCAGLGYAHRNGIIHRDVKPGNLMITGEGTLKILDFGLARVMSEAVNSLTRAGAIMGTPHYMSPEQFEGRPVDPRSDIFAVGAVLYELISYRKAYPGDTPHVVLNQIVNGAPTPILDLVPGLDPELGAAVARALAKRPEDRHQTLAELAADLERVRARCVEGAEPTIRVTPGAKSTSTPTPSAGTDQTPTRGARAQANLDAIAQRRAAQVEGHVKAATEHLSAGRFEDAVAACENAVLLDPLDARALDLLARAHAAIDEQQVHAWLEDAKVRLAAGDLTAAQALIDQSLMLRGDSSEALRLERDVRERREERERLAERARAAAAALERATRSLADGEPDVAARTVSEVLAFDPGNAAALQIREQATAALEERRRQEFEHRAATCVATAAALADAGDLTGAITTLDAFSPAHPAVTDALTRTRTRRDELERQRAEAARIRQRVEEARAAMLAALADGRFEGAQQVLDRARAELPGNADLERLAASVAAAKDTADRQVRELARQHVARAETSLSRGDLDDASEALDETLRLTPDDPRAADLLQQLRLAREQQVIASRLPEPRRAAPASVAAETVVVPSPAVEAATVIVPRAPTPEPPTVVVTPFDAAEAATVLARPSPPPPTVVTQVTAPLAARPPVAQTPAVPAMPPPVPLPPAPRQPVPTAADAARPVAQTLRAPVAPRSPMMAAVPALAAIVLLVAGGVWYATRSPAPTPAAESEPAVVTPSPAEPGSTPATPGPGVTPGNAPAPAASATTRPPTPAPAIGATPATTAPAPTTATTADADALRLHERVVASLGQGDLDAAARALSGASPAVLRHPTVAQDANALLRRAKLTATEAANAALKSSTARASDDFREAERNRAEAASRESRGQLVEAVRSHLAAAVLFELAARATPAAPIPTNPVVTAPPPGASSTSPAPSSPAPETAKPTPPAATPAPPSPATTPAPVDTAASDTAAINAVLAQYVAAYERRDVTEIRRVFPGAPAALDLSNVRSYSIALENPQIVLQGNLATVTAVRKLRVQLNAGAAQQQTLRTQFTLRRNGGGWIIDQVR